MSFVARGSIQIIYAKNQLYIGIVFKNLQNTCLQYLRNNGFVVNKKYMEYFILQPLVIKTRRRL